MRISRSAGYALVAVGYVGENYQDGAVLASKVAKEYKIPLEYLLKILQQLVRANILRSKRGPRGGFFLARPAESITILEIIEAVDGPLMSHLHISDQAHGAEFGVKMEEVCKTATVEVREIFAKAKLANMLS